MGSLASGILCAVALCGPCLAGGVAAAGLPPLDEAGLSDYRDYQEAPGHRAFALAPGGVWAWSSNGVSVNAAEVEAQSRCRSLAHGPCLTYDLDGRQVFDALAWARIWRPYADASRAMKEPVDTIPGRRMPDLMFRDGRGKQWSVSSFRGRVLVLHFWGSWCGPCRRELPELQALRDTLSARRDIVFALLQVREPYAVSRRWADSQSLRLPLYDSGEGEDTEGALRLSTGEKIGDRDVARYFPTTYIIDKRGIILFVRTGPVAAWSSCALQLLDAADYSGR